MNSRGSCSRGEGSLQCRLGRVQTGTRALEEGFPPREVSIRQGSASEKLRYTLEKHYEENLVLPKPCHNLAGPHFETEKMREFCCSCFYGLNTSAFNSFMQFLSKNLLVITAQPTPNPRLPEHLSAASQFYRFVLTLSNPGHALPICPSCLFQLYSSIKTYSKAICSMEPPRGLRS